MVTDKAIKYSFKSIDRSRLDALSTKKGDCDEIIIVKHGLVIDTFFTNLAIYNSGSCWIIPKYPLLFGTKRAYLLSHCIIQEVDITLQNLKKCQSIRLFNSMIEFGEMEIPIKITTSKSHVQSDNLQSYQLWLHIYWAFSPKWCTLQSQELFEHYTKQSGWKQSDFR